MSTLAHDTTTNMTPFDELTAEIDDLYAEAKHWCDGSPIETEEQAAAIDKLDKMLHAAGRKLDVLRIAEKKPLDEAIEAIQNRFNPYIQPKRGKVAVARDSLNPLIVAFRTKQREEKEAAALRARLEAEKLKETATEAIQSSAGNLEARERAEEQLALAKEADSFAGRQEKAAATGNGLRATPRPVLTDLNAAVKHYWATHRDDFEALVVDLAGKDVRAGKRSIPGFEIKIEERAI